MIEPNLFSIYSPNIPLSFYITIMSVSKSNTAVVAAKKDLDLNSVEAL